MKNKQQFYFQSAKSYEEDVLLRAAVETLCHFGLCKRNSDINKEKYAAFQESRVADNGSSILILKRNLFNNEFYEIQPETGRVFYSAQSVLGSEMPRRASDFGQKLKECLDVTADRIKDADLRSERRGGGASKANADGEGK